jgi:hypothetical protein
VAVAAVAVEAVVVMVILTMDMVVVTMATAAGEAIDGNCSNDPPFPFPRVGFLRLARLGSALQT